jgi:hypothetical protein
MPAHVFGDPNPSGSVTDIWVRRPFTVFLNQISDIDLAEDGLFDLHNNQKLHFDFNYTEGAGLAQAV